MIESYLSFFLNLYDCCNILFAIRTCLELADICKEVNLPAGVLNVVTGLGTEAGAPLSSHPKVDKVHFFIPFMAIFYYFGKPWLLASKYVYRIC